MNTLKILLTILILSLSNIIFASNFAIGTIGSSYHFDQNSRLNENHRGFYMKYKKLIIGRAVNSIENTSNFYLYQSSINKINDFDYSVIGGIATNYGDLSNNLTGTVPVVGFKIRYKFAWIMVAPIGLLSGLEWDF